MTDNVFNFPRGEHAYQVNPDEILREAEEKLDFALVLGWDKDDCLYLTMSENRSADIIYILEKAKHIILSQGAKDV